jgi:hypothetical protein
MCVRIDAGVHPNGRDPLVRASPVAFPLAALTICVPAQARVPRRHLGGRGVRQVALQAHGRDQQQQQQQQ